MLKFPYGVSDFYKIATEGFFYVDRTEMIRKIEDIGNVLLFLRPRRFGKSLWLSILENYYDVAKADEFERLFGSLAIGQNPTPLHNKYLIMRWNFSAVNPHGSVEEIQDSLFDHINGCVEQFASRYQDVIKHHIVLDESNALRSMQSVLAAVQETPYRLYLLIDEYDNFANEVLVASMDRYESLVRGEGLLRTVFKVVKSGVEGLGVDRIFITGVSPVAMSDITRSFNTSKDLSLRRDLNSMCGFTEDEVRAVTEQVVSTCEQPPATADALVETMRTFYNGYRFHQDMTRVYNPTLVLYFLDSYQVDCKSPRHLLDSNLAMDRHKLSYIAHLPHGQPLVLKALEDKPILVLALSDRFGVRDMIHLGEDTTAIASLLYYLGILTLAGEARTGELVLTIPNLVTRGLYAEQIRDLLLPQRGIHEVAQQAARILYRDANPAPLCEFVEQHIFPVFSNRDYYQANELTVKTAFLSLLFNDILYVMDSEPELERGYADLTMIIRSDMRRFEILDILLEFKFLKLAELGLSGEDVRQKSRTELMALPQVQAKLAEAKAQLAKYRPILEAKYGDKLRLHSFAIVSLGFEKLVWQEVA